MYEPPPENPPQIEPDEVNVGLLGVVGTFLAVVVVLIVVLLQAWSIIGGRASRRSGPSPPTAPRRRWAGHSSNSGRLSAATTGSIGRRKSGRSPSSGRWNWWPTKWPPHRSPWRNRPRNEVDHDGHWFAKSIPNNRRLTAAEGVVGEVARAFRRLLAAGYFGVAILALTAAAQTNEPPPPGYEGATVVEKPNAQVPLDIEFVNEDGRTVRLAILPARPARALNPRRFPMPDAL